jgi:hypothetical protein
VLAHFRYSPAEFECGPNLNMIIGPNGTGEIEIELKAGTAQR